MTEVTVEQGSRTGGAAWWWYAAIVLHVAIGVFPVGATGLLAPAAGVAAAGALWLGGAWWLWRTRRGARTLLGPVLTLAAWVALVAAGDAFLGWTA